MSLAEELEKLTVLRRSGALTPEEFSAAKHQLLSGKAIVPGSPSPSPPPLLESRALADAVERYLGFQVLGWLVTLIVLLLLFFLVIQPHFSAGQPTVEVHLPGH